MRRRGHIALTLCVAAASEVAAAQAPPASVQGRVALYADDDRTTVWRPRVSGAVPAGDVGVAASWTADVVSSASIDVVTRASRPVEETRHELGAQVTLHGDEALELGAGYTLGTEPDYTTHAVSLRAARDLGALRLWHATAGIGASTSAIGTVVDDRFEEDAQTLQAAASLSRITDPVTVVRAALELSLTTGFQSSAYRTVRLGDWTGAPYTGDDPDATPWVFTGVTGVAREQHPDLRRRARLALDAVRDLGGNVAAYAQVAGYADDWGIEAAEVSAEARIEPAPGLLLRVGGRGYVQTGAWFWRARYVGRDQTGGYLTDDKELGPLHSYTAHAAATIPWRDLRLDLRVEGTRYAYLEFDLLPRKHALSLQLALTWEPQ